MYQGIVLASFYKIKQDWCDYPIILGPGSEPGFQVNRVKISEI
jgi:hypothetical protein